MSCHVMSCHVMSCFVGPKFVLSYCNRFFVGILGICSGDFFAFDLYIYRGSMKKDLGKIEDACKDWKKAAELGDEGAAELLKEHCGG